MALTNNALNNQSTTSIANATQTFTVSNSNNTGTSAARIAISVGGGTTSGDPKTMYTVTGATDWSVGIDNSTSDSFKISNSTDLGTNAFQIITTSGVVNWNSQPAFLAYQATNVTNATGTGTVYQIGSSTALTEVFDRSGEFNTNGTFTSSVTGQYYFACNAQIENCTINTSVAITIVTSNRSYSKTFNRAAASTSMGISLATLADLDSGDTAQYTIAGSGEAGDTETVSGSGGLLNYFCGYLMA